MALESLLAELQPQFSGELITPEHPDYQSARTVFNGMIDRRPAVIAQCATTDDVVRAVRAASRAGVDITVRGGGHSVAGLAVADDALVIDLRRMNSAIVDPDAMTVTLGGGATMGDLDRAGEPFGLATTGGRVSTTGVGGFVLGGGGGWLDRTFGLACDNLVSAQVVTASGDVVHASADEHPDLFWALHGGGGNFGIVTQLTLALHSVPVSTLAILLWPPAEAPRVFRRYRDFIEDEAPDEFGGGMVFLTGPDDEFVPNELRGQLTAAILVTFIGTESTTRSVMAPLLDLGHVGELVMELPYADLNSALDDPPGYRNYWTAEYLRELPDSAIDAFCARADGMVVPSPSQFALFPQGGAVTSGPTIYPVPWRQALWVIHPFGLWDDPADDDRARAWARDARADVSEWAIDAVYLNFIGDEGRERVVAGFGHDNYARLVTVKDRYDPDNVFRHNHNIIPSRSA